MKCTVTCFDRVLHLVRELPKEKLQEAVEVVQEYSFYETLEYFAECGCFTKAQLSTLYEGIVMWEDLDGNYWEEDYDRLMALYEAVGLSEEIWNEYAE